MGPHTKLISSTPLDTIVKKITLVFVDLPCKYFFNNITDAFRFVIGKCGKLFDDDLLLNMINKTLAVFLFAQSHVLILRAAIWVSIIIIIIIIMITIRTLINPPQKNVPNYN